MPRLLHSIDRGVAVVTRWMMVSALAVIFVLMLLGVFVRLVPVFSMSGYDEVIELLVAWLAFLGAAALLRQGALFSVDLVSLIGSRTVTLVARLVVQLLILGFAIILTWQGFIFASGAIETMPFLQVSKQPWYFAMVAGGVLMCGYGLVGLLAIVMPVRASTDWEQGNE